MSTAPHTIHPKPTPHPPAEPGSHDQRATASHNEAEVATPADRRDSAAACSEGAASAGPGCAAASADARPGQVATLYKRSLMDRIDAFASRLAARNNFWQRLASLIWLPYAFKSGIRMKRIDANTFSAVLPFRRFNRNWYNAMAGAALLANSEVAGGMYVFGICGGDYEVVCKHLEYKFLRPCLGPAIYRINPREDVQALAASRGEFNVTLDLDILQQIGKPGSRERRVGKCTVTFHVTPKTHQKAKGRKV